MDKKNSQFMAALAISALDDVPTPASNAKNVVALLNKEENLAEGISTSPTPVQSDNDQNP